MTLEEDISEFVRGTCSKLGAKNALMTHSFIEDLGLDDIDLIELAFEVEDKYEIDLPCVAMFPKTVSELCELIKSLVEEKQ